jgi:UDP-glucose 4-epimerase
MIKNKSILIFGGTGSLGYELNKQYCCNGNTVYNFSRDENKHWQMRIFFQNLIPSADLQHFIIGNVSDYASVQQTILRIKPQIIIIASAMKHIDQCENNTGECIKTNLLGTQNILNAIEHNLVLLSARLETVVFVSSDKACSPVNSYGLCKAMSENMVVEKSLYIPSVKFVNVRYGNVLNSNGSIIPLLHKIGQSPEHKQFTLTSEEMTRFLMTLEQSVELINHAIINGKTGDTIIPKLISINILDLFRIFSRKYKKSVIITSIRPGEKIIESLINETQSLRTIKDGDYTHIKSVFSPITINNTPLDYNSKTNPLTE